MKCVRNLFSSFKIIVVLSIDGDKYIIYLQKMCMFMEIKTDKNGPQEKETANSLFFLHFSIQNSLFLMKVNLQFVL